MEERRNDDTRTRTHRPYLFTHLHRRAEDKRIKDQGAGLEGPQFLRALLPPQALQAQAVRAPLVVLVAVKEEKWGFVICVCIVCFFGWGGS